MVDEITITARPFEPSTHLQAARIVEDGFIREGGRFNDWREVAGDQDIYDPLRETQHHVSQNLQHRHPYKGEPAHFYSGIHEDQVSTAFGNRTIPKYAALLTVENLPDEKRLESLMSIYDLLSNQEYKCTAIECGVVGMCSSLLSSNHPGVREHSARVIATLVQVIQGAQAIQRSGGLVKLTDLLEDPETKVREAASMALMVVSGMRGGARDVIESQERALSCLVAAIFDPKSQSTNSLPSPNVVFHIVTVIANLTALLDGRAVGKALKSGVVQKLVKLLEGESQSPPKLQVKVLNSIWNLSIQEEGKSPVIDAGAVPLIVRAVESAINVEGDVFSQVRRYGSGALLSLSVHEVCKGQLQDAHALSTISTLLYDPAASTRQNAISTIHHVSESPEGLAAFTQQIMSDSKLLVEVFAERCAPPLTKLLVDPDAQTRSYAVAAIALLTTDARFKGDPLGPGQPVGQANRVGWSAGVLQCLHVVEYLIQRLGDSDSSVVQAAVLALTNICKQSPRAFSTLEKAIQESLANADDFPELF